MPRATKIQLNKRDLQSTRGTSSNGEHAISAVVQVDKTVLSLRAPSWSLEGRKQIEKLDSKVRESGADVVCSQRTTRLDPSEVLQRSPNCPFCASALDFGAYSTGINLTGSLGPPRRSLRVRLSKLSAKRAHDLRSPAIAISGLRLRSCTRRTPHVRSDARFQPEPVLRRSRSGPDPRFPKLGRISPNRR